MEFIQAIKLGQDLSVADLVADVDVARADLAGYPKTQRTLEAGMNLARIDLKVLGVRRFDLGDTGDARWFFDRGGCMAAAQGERSQQPRACNRQADR